MKINGNLSFLGLGQIENLRVENLGTDPVAPAEGQVWYNTADDVYRGYANGQVITFASGGNTATLQTEIDAIEAAVGLATDGTFVGFNGTTHMGSATSVVAALVALDTAVAGAAAAVLTEAAARAAADTVLTDDLAQEVLDRIAGDAANATAVTNEATARAGADATLTTNLAAEVTRATAAEGVVAAAVTAEEVRALAAEAALAAADTAAGTALADEIARALAAEGVVATAVVTEQTRATSAEGLLSDRITIEVTDRTNADTALATAVANEAAARESADDAFQIALDAEITTRSAADVALSAELANAISGLTWEAPVDQIVADVSVVDLTGVADGTRIVDVATSKIFTVTAEALNAGEALVDGAAFYDKDTDVPYTFNGTALAQLNGAGSIFAGTGLTKTGNTLNIASTSGTITVSADSIDVAQAVLDSITTVSTNLASEVTRATTAETGLGDRIDDEEAARAAADTAMTAAYEAAVLVEKNRAEAAELALATSVTAEETRALAAEAALATSVTAETTRATAAEVTNAAAIAAEEARALAAEAALGTAATGAVAAETTRATAAEAALAADLAAEVARATAAEALVASNAAAALAGEVSRATAAEAALVAANAGGYFLFDGSVASMSHVVNHAIGSKFCNVTVVDSSDQVVIPQSITFNSASQLTVTFNTAITCKIIVMGLFVGV